MAKTLKDVYGAFETKATLNYGCYFETLLIKHIENGVDDYIIYQESYNNKFYRRKLHNDDGDDIYFYHRGRKLYLGNAMII